MIKPLFGTLLLLCALMISASMHARETILVLGDSISAAYGIQREEGWVYLLEQRLLSQESAWKVVNASLSGETTGGGLARLPAALQTHNPGVVVIELGGNDGLRGYPVARIRENLEHMVKLALEGGRRVLLLGMQIPPNYGPRYTQAFYGIYSDIARIHQVELVPFLLEEVALQPELMQSDGIHPTANAQPQLLDTVWGSLTPLISECDR